MTYSKSDGDCFHRGWYIQIDEDGETAMRRYVMPFSSEASRDAAWDALMADAQSGEVFA